MTGKEAKARIDECFRHVDARDRVHRVVNELVGELRSVREQLKSHAGFLEVRDREIAERTQDWRDACTELESLRAKLQQSQAALKIAEAGASSLRIALDATKLPVELDMTHASQVMMDVVENVKASQASKAIGTTRMNFTSRLIRAGDLRLADLVARSSDAGMVAIMASGFSERCAMFALMDVNTTMPGVKVKFSIPFHGLPCTREVAHQLSKIAKESKNGNPSDWLARRMVSGDIVYAAKRGDRTPFGGLLCTKVELASAKAKAAERRAHEAGSNGDHPGGDVSDAMERVVLGVDQLLADRPVDHKDTNE